MNLNDLALFTAVARHLSFSEAADQLGIPLSRVSRRVAELEDYLGTKLFERTTRQVRLTEEGRRLLDQCQEPIETLQSITGSTSETKMHKIRLTAPPLAARMTVGPRLLDFAAQHPDIQLDLVATNVMLDFFRDNIDLAFRLGPLSDSSLVARQLWDVPYGFCAGAAFAAAHGLSEPVSLDLLTRLPAIKARQAWILSGGEQVKALNVRHTFDDLDLVAQAARRNLGIALLPVEMMVDGLHHFNVRDAEPMQRQMFAVYPSRRLLPARIRSLIDFMVRPSGAVFATLAPAISSQELSAGS